MMLMTSSLTDQHLDNALSPRLSGKSKKSSMNGLPTKEEVATAATTPGISSNGLDSRSPTPMMNLTGMLVKTSLMPMAQKLKHYKTGSVVAHRKPQPPTRLQHLHRLQHLY